MNIYQEQVKRIKTKLAQARQTDFNLKVFGAKSHKYVLGKPAFQNEVEELEKKYNFKLPICYKTFLLEIGNGDSLCNGSAAGPFYGIYPLGQNLNEILEVPEYSMGLPAIIRPGITDEEWESLKSKLDSDNLSDDDYEEQMGKIFAGVLPIGSQGCSYLHALIVTGEYAGRVVNIDLELSKPRFCFEKNFLDWYERWLDEIISGVLLSDGPSWFGYSMGGNAKELLEVYDAEIDPGIKHEALNGMVKLLSADEKICDKILLICSEPNKKLAHLAAQLITKFSYPKSKNTLNNLIEGNDEDCLVACQGIFWYQRKHAFDWLDQLRHRLKRVDDKETFVFATHLIRECKVDYALDLAPFFKHNNCEIRAYSYYLLGNLTNKRDYLDQFIEGLSDEFSRVVHATLQALEGVRDRSLLREYFKVLQRYPKEKDCILVNIGHRLKEQGFDSRSDFLRRYDPETDQIAGKFGLLASMINMFN